MIPVAGSGGRRGRPLPMPRGRRPEAGVVLVNVLVVLALASAVLVAMIRLSDLAIARSRTFQDAARAEALIAGGETSARAALLRDMVEAPGTDHPGEAWAAVSQDEVAVEGGSFGLSLSDASARLNLRALRGQGGVAPQILARIARQIGLPAGAAARIAALVRGAAADPPDLRAAGLDDAQARALGRLAAFLPVDTDLNLNTAPEELILAIADNPVQARGLIALRRLKGHLEPADLAAVNLVLLPGIGYASRLFEVRVTARIGSVRRSGGSLLLRRIGAAGRPEVVAIRRWRGE